MNKFEQLLKSRKFWAALIGLIVVFTGSRAGVDQTELVSAVILLVSYILGVAVEDAKAKG